MTSRLRTVARRGATTFAVAVGALLLSVAAVSATTTFGTSSITTTGTIQVDGNATFDTNTLFVDATNNRVGVGNAAPAAAFSVGSASQLQVDSSGNLMTTGTLTVGSSVTNSDKLLLVPFGSGSTTFTGTLTTVDLTAARTWTLPDVTGTLATLAGTETFTNKTLTTPRIGTAILDANGNAVLSFGAASTAVNALTVKNAATGNAPSLSAEGSDANISLTLFPKGSGTVVVSTTVANADKLLLAANTAGSTGFGGTVTSTDLTTSQTWTLPDASGTVVLETAAASLSNKTLLSPIVTATNVSSNSLAVKALASQTANLQEWQDSTGTALASVAANGALAIPTVAIGGGTAIVKHLSATGLVGNGGTSLTSLNCIADAITVNGAATGDSVVATPTQALEGNVMWSAYVSGTNSVSVTLCNPTASPVSVNDRIWRVDVWKH